MSVDEEKTDLVMANALRAFMRGGPGPYEARQLRGMLESGGFEPDEAAAIMRRWAVSFITFSGEDGRSFTITEAGHSMIESVLDEGENEA